MSQPLTSHCGNLCDLAPYIPGHNEKKKNVEKRSLELSICMSVRALGGVMCVLSGSWFGLGCPALSSCLAFVRPVMNCGSLGLGWCVSWQQERRESSGEWQGTERSCDLLGGTGRLQLGVLEESSV